MRWLAVLLLVLGVAGCGGRPLAQGERALASDLFGPNFDADKARVGLSAGLPAPRNRSEPEVTRDVAPRPGVCDRTAPGDGPSGPPPAFVLYNRMSVQPEFYRADMMPDWPRRVLIPEVLIVAHELVHIWQWQNRALTGYRPTRAAMESLTNRDPYFYTPEPDAGFLAYGYEQQAALVEDYVCYLLFDPNAPRRAKLRRILSPYFTVDRLERALNR